jgi:hypothetical protein
MDGVLAAALVDLEDVSCLASAAREVLFDGAAVAEGVAGLVRADGDMAETLRLGRGSRELLLTLEDRLHLIRRSGRAPRLALFLALDRDDASLGMLRLDLEDVEEALGL